MSLDTFDTVLSFSAVMLVLSLFVTAMVQLVAAVLKLRHGSLLWGVERLLLQLDTNGVLQAQGHALANRIVKGFAPLSSGAAWFGGGAKAIKPDELVKALRALAQANDTTAAGQAAAALVASIGTAAPVADLAGKLGAIQTELATLFPAQAQAATEAVERAIHSRDELARRTGDWFDTVMDRSAERFTLHTRFVAVGLAGVLVLGMGVDAGHLYRTLRDDAALRAAQVATVAPLLENAKRILEPTCGAVPPTPAASTAAAARTPADADAAAAQRDCLDASLARVNDLARQHVTSVQPLTVQERLWPFLGSACQRAGVTPPASCDARTAALTAWLHHAPGLLLSWVLLTLGAPFWFNTLKNLSSLRPLIASRADQTSR